MGSIMDFCQGRVVRKEKGKKKGEAARNSKKSSHEKMKAGDTSTTLLSHGLGGHD